MFYQCFKCHKDISSELGEHYEIIFVRGYGSAHTPEHKITVCELCYLKIKGGITNE